MRIKCEYCGNYIDDSDEKCAYCGAANNGIKRTGTGVPTTIEQLKRWYIDHNLPDENTTRFFIGRDYPGPKAFGIFKDSNTGNYIVYKNKADGTRATRYSGKDEAYAVNEIYQKLKEEIAIQKGRSVKSNYNVLNSKRSFSSAYNNSNNGAPIGLIILIIIIVLFALSMIGERGSSNGGYNRNRSYSSYSSYYDDDDSYSYSRSYDYDNDNSYSSSWSSSDWDSDSSWSSSDSWDSDWSDWDSDW